MLPPAAPGTTATVAGMLGEAFSVGAAQSEALQVHAIDVPCGDGTTETTYALVALDTAGPAWQAWQQRDDHFEGVLRWMFRRGDDLASMMRCRRDK